jgi:cell division protein FtsL
LAAAVAIAIVVIVVLDQRQAKSNGEIVQLREEGKALQEENENLRQQIAQVHAPTTPESRPAVDTSDLIRHQPKVSAAG